ncbi:LamG-like jellyroll fold domain-containing protein, partial [Nitrosopumilus sp.]|uniref:LamG-like jellyroll fold domain-containing protein n=1 Tax=Nitrosopumilus sp. TaxID=2024843 RepID=UPI00247B8DDE
MSISDLLEIIFTPKFSTDKAKINEENTVDLNGYQDFLQINENSTNNLQSFVISTWIKPDYSHGSPEFTIMSKEGSFSLAVNNLKSGNTAKFSIFDGIKWTQVDSISEIPEEWTHILASFSNQTISIYVNGEFEGAIQLTGIPSLSIDGKLEYVDIENISSENDIVVGAYITTRNNISHPNNMFSGMIDEILLFDYSLSETEIGQLYSQGKSAHGPTQEKTLDDILKEIEQEMAALQAQNYTQILQAQMSLSDILSTAHIQAQISSDSLQAQMSLSDILSTTHIQAQKTPSNPQAQISSDSLQAQMSLSDILSFDYSQARNNTSAIIVVPDISPHLTPVKDTFTINEEAEIVFEFFTETEAMVHEFENLDVAIETAETDTENALNPSPLDEIFGLFVLPIPEADAAKDDGTSIKAKIKQLKKEISQIKKSETVSGNQLETIKNKINILVQQIKEEAKESKQQKKTDKLNSVIEKLEKITNKQHKQKDNWNDKETITTEVYDANNNKVELDVIFEKQREGKFNIKFDPAKAKPGIYKIKTILNMDGKQFISESEFAWGLVSVNSMKSIYKPGELAELEIVVLNGTGAPVCPANAIMQITDPNLSSTLISSNDIIEASCGLYLANYPTSIIGNYTINVQAETGNGIVNFSTYFTVLDNYDYDIVRYTDSKIDPFVDPNDFDVDIDITSFVGNDELTIHEYVPSSFGIFNTDATVETVGNYKVLTWKKTPQDGYVETFSYSYSVPLVTPELYPLGKMEIKQSGVPTFTEARNWFVAVDPHFLIDTSVTINDDRWQDASKRTVAVNGSHVYSFYIDAEQDLAYSYSTDGGFSWNYGAEIESVNNLFIGIATWYELDTPGLTDNFIHIAAYDGGDDAMFYIKFDPSDATIVTPLVDISDGAGDFGTLADAGNISITQGTNGDIYIGTIDGSSTDDPLSRVRVCTESGHSCESQSDWGNAGARNTIWGNDDGNDSLILLPLPNDDDILLVSLDISGHDLRSKQYDQSAGTWDAGWTTIDTGIVDSTAYDHAVSGVVDKKTGDLYVTAVPNVAATDSEVRIYRYVDGSGWYTLPKVTSTDGSKRYIDTSVGINGDSGKLYAIYSYGAVATSNDVYYKSTSIPSISWSSEKLLTNSTSNFRGLSINNYNENLLYADFFDTNINRLYGSPIVKQPLLSETLEISDDLVIGISASRTLTETLSMSDNISAAITEEIDLSETLNVSDAIVTNTPLTNIILDESLSISDSVSLSISIISIISETLSLSDNVDAAKRSPGDDPDARPLKVTVYSGTSSSDPTTITLDSPLADASKAFAMCSFNHDKQSVHNKIFRAWELDDTTLTIHATAKSPGPNSVNYVCNVIEFGNASTVEGSTQSFTQAASGSTLVTTTLSGTPVDLSETMEWYQGHTHDNNESQVGSEEIDRIRLTSSTQWEWEVKTAPGSGPQDNYMGLFDWNNLEVNVQRGQTSISSGSTTTTITPPTSIDRTRSLLFVSFIKDDTAFDYIPNQSYIHATINSNNDLVFARNSGTGAPAIEINWTLVELPEDYANIRHGTHTQSDTQSNTTFDLEGGDSITNVDRAFVIGTVCSPFGCGTGSGSSTVAGSIDRIQSTLQLDDANTIRVIRGDGTGTFTVGYQTIEFLPKKVVLTETLFISDFIITQNIGTVTLSETLTPSDVITTNIARTADLSETLTLSDTITTNYTASTTLSETLTPSDAITTMTIASTTLSETLTPSDAITTMTIASTTLSETLTPSDVVATNIARTADLSETLTLSDTITTNYTASTTLSETLTPSDVLTTTTAASVTLDETLTASDVITTTSAQSATLTETLTASDVLTTTTAASVTLDETLTASDVLTTTTAASVTLDETLTASDVITTTSAQSATLTETLTASDV